MRVEVLRATEKPERLVCQAARGDYYEGYVGDTDYADLMESVDFDDQDIKAVEGQANHYIDHSLAEKHGSGEHIELQAKTRSFIRKQLSRGHYGPWEHPQITFAVEGVSRVTMAQITRHRHMTFDIQSMRYADFSDTEAIIPKSLTDDSHFSRETGEVDVEVDRELLKSAYRAQCEMAFDEYQEMVDAGVPKEDARFVLPLGTPVNMTFSGNARTFLHLLDMRKKANAQWGIRELSEALLDELFEWMPYTFNYYEEHGPNKLSP